MTTRRMLLAAAAFIVVAGCSHYEMKPDDGMQEWKTTVVNAGVTVTPDGAGGFSFKYAGDYVDEEGNFDFSQGEIAKGRVKMVISIADGPAALMFKPEGRNAMWIVEKKLVGEGSPKAAYQGDQFLDFSTSRDRKTISVTNRNNDGMVYRYNLRFDLDGRTVEHDPDTTNGNGGHG